MTFRKGARLNEEDNYFSSKETTTNYKCLQVPGSNVADYNQILQDSHYRESGNCHNSHPRHNRNYIALTPNSHESVLRKNNADTDLRTGNYMEQTELQ